MAICTNCNCETVENYCPNCGQAASLTRIDKHYISHEVQHLMHFEKGLFYTIKQLFLRPGLSVREFIDENRSKHMKPFPFLILTSILYTVVAHFFHADQIYNERDTVIVDSPTFVNIQHWVQTHYGYSNILMGIFIAICVRLFFRKYKYNFFEITVLMCFVMGQSMLYLTLEALFFGLITKQAFILILTAISFIYPTWAIGQFFDKGKILSYVKALFAYLFGYLLFYFVIIIVAVGVDVLIGINK